MTSLKNVCPSAPVVAAQQKVSERIVVRRRGHVGMREQALDFGREHEGVANEAVVQGLDANRVAGKKQLLLAGIENAQREITVQVFDESISI